MNGLEEQADNAQERDLNWKPLSSPAAIIVRLLSAAAKNTLWTFTTTTQPLVPPKRTTGWSL
jgi:hypothetical protein